MGSLSQQKYDEQSRKIADMADHWFDFFNSQLENREVPLTERPLKALIMLLNTPEAMEINAGESIVDSSRLLQQSDNCILHILYSAVEYWYIDRYGPLAIEAKGNPPPLWGCNDTRGYICNFSSSTSD